MPTRRKVSSARWPTEWTGGFFKEKTHPRPGPLFEIISFARNTQRPLGETISRFYPQHEDLSDLIIGFAAAYRERKQKQSVVDYDDLLEYWLEVLRAAPDVATYLQQRFRHTLVDEYQDTNTLQAQIVDLVGAHHRVMAVGDDAQCIYSWRGADFENIMTFPDRHPGTQIYRIETNYRSTPSILAFANGVLAAQPKGRHFDKELRAVAARSRKAVPGADARHARTGFVRRPAHQGPRRRRPAAGRYRRALPGALPCARSPARTLPARHAVRDHERRAVLRAGAHPRPRRHPALRLQSERLDGLAAHRRAAAAGRRQGGAKTPRRGARPRPGPSAQPRGCALVRRRAGQGAQGVQRGMAPAGGLAAADRRQRSGATGRSRQSRSPSRAGTGIISRAPTPTTLRGWTT